MKLHQSSYLARFYARSYDMDIDCLPVNFCSFFWNLSWSLVVLPITWWTYRWKLPMGIRVLFGFLSNGLIALLVFGFVTNWLTTVLTIAVILGIALITFVGFYFQEEGPPQIVKDAADIVSTKWHSTKENYCPRIDWQ